MARAAILRSHLSTVMACLDPPDPRGNRASVGGILEILKDADVVRVMAEGKSTPESQAAVLRQANDGYNALVEGDLFQHGRRLRNDAIAHVLIPDNPTPIVTYETMFDLHDAAELVFHVCARGSPRFVDAKDQLTEHAKVFWDTYFAGMHAKAT